jgi:hypothetical protein
VQRPVHGNIVEIEPDDPVERREGFGLEGLEHPASIHSSRRARRVVSDTW